MRLKAHLQEFSRYIAVRFYNEQYNLSTSDFYTKSPKKAGKYYEVERVIGQRTRKRKEGQL
jgi:hypothetical protein